MTLSLMLQSILPMETSGLTTVCTHLIWRYTLKHPRLTPFSRVCQYTSGKRIIGCALLQPFWTTRYDREPPQDLSLPLQMVATSPGQDFCQQSRQFWRQQRYTGHSFRIRAAITVALEGIPDSLIQVLG